MLIFLNDVSVSNLSAGSLAVEHEIANLVARVRLSACAYNNL